MAFPARSNKAGKLIFDKAILTAVLVSTAEYLSSIHVFQKSRNALMFYLNSLCEEAFRELKAQKLLSVHKILFCFTKNDEADLSVRLDTFKSHDLLSIEK